MPAINDWSVLPSNPGLIGSLPFPPPCSAMVTSSSPPPSMNLMMLFRAVATAFRASGSHSNLT